MGWKCSLHFCQRLFLRSMLSGDFSPAPMKSSALNSPYRSALAICPPTFLTWRHPCGWLVDGSSTMAQRRSSKVLRQQHKSTGPVFVAVNDAQPALDQYHTVSTGVFNAGFSFQTAVKLLRNDCVVWITIRLMPVLLRKNSIRRKSFWCIITHINYS